MILAQLLFGHAANSSTPLSEHLKICGNFFSW
ncbi:Uncharacterised protein [Mycobacteroides abscessus subsp. abscessus]|nr:Uncharacterised protein [Mycobacteroides abscessus subsp. abscessus]SKU02121.1 Uncharacterised protein [Mycobacteroides abscessus subsp. abscessus]